MTDTWEVTKQYTYEPVTAYAESPITPPFALTINENSKDECSCVKYVRGIIPSLPRGNAKDLETNSIYPIKNSAVKLSYGDNFQVDKYHLAYVESVQPDGIHIVSDCKYGKHEIIREIIPLESDLIQGYWTPRE